jgi:hypothetical protein
MQLIIRITTTYISGKFSECCRFFAPTAGGWSAIRPQCNGVRELGTRLTEGWVCPITGLVAGVPHTITKPYIQICVAYRVGWVLINASLDDVVIV